ncbi:MAG: GAF and ANTAR domain-containing protein [Streptosporangiaceae bacterium]|jgi:hypothetical protein
MTMPGQHADPPAAARHREQDVARTFVMLADSLVEDYDIVDLLDRLAEACVRLLGADRPRWPLFASFALEAGFRSVAALPMRLREQTIGGLNLFDDRAVPVAPDDQRLAQALADVATIGILQQRSAQRSNLLAEHLQRALNSRVVIEQAKGVLAERNGMSMDAAFDSLRSYARDQNLKLTDLAVAIVHHDFNPAVRKGPPPAPDQRD